MRNEHFRPRWHVSGIIPYPFIDGQIYLSFTVISTYSDPMAAWSNSYGGMNGVTAGIGAGLLRNLYWKNIQLNLICADFVTNGSLAIAWHTAAEHRAAHKLNEPKIYHINRYSDDTLYFGALEFLFHFAIQFRFFIPARSNGSTSNYYVQRLN